jgi:hypothetical protein
VASIAQPGGPCASARKEPKGRALSAWVVLTGVLTAVQSSVGAENEADAEGRKSKCGRTTVLQQECDAGMLSPDWQSPAICLQHFISSTDSCASGSMHAIIGAPVRRTHRKAPATRQNFIPQAYAFGHAQAMCRNGFVPRCGMERTDPEVIEKAEVAQDTAFCRLKNEAFVRTIPFG